MMQPADPHVHILIASVLPPAQNQKQITFY